MLHILPELIRADINIIEQRWNSTEKIICRTCTSGKSSAGVEGRKQASCIKRGDRLVWGGTVATVCLVAPACLSGSNLATGLLWAGLIDAIHVVKRDLAHEAAMILWHKYLHGKSWLLITQKLHLNDENLLLIIEI